MKLALDHLVYVAPTLGAGVAAIESALGVTMSGGGSHPGMGTRNRLLRLGDVYLEVLARDPGASPTRARWFGLDDARFAEDAKTPPSLHSFVLRADDLDEALSAMLDAAGPAIDAQRGDLKWRIGVRGDGAMPCDGAFPTLIEWPNRTGPAPSMPDSGCRLIALDISHPDAARIAAALDPVFSDRRVRFKSGALSLRAIIETPKDRVTI